jgi:uncharacterized protein YlxP (DUF503 family)
VTKRSSGPSSAENLVKFFVGIGRYQLDMSACSSLKDKRRILKSVVDRLGNSKVTGVSEVGANDYWKSGTLALTCVSVSRDVVEHTLDKARRTVESCGVEVIESERWILRPDDLEDNL